MSSACTPKLICDQNHVLFKLNLTTLISTTHTINFRIIVSDTSGYRVKSISDKAYNMIAKQSEFYWHITE